MALYPIARNLSARRVPALEWVIPEEPMVSFKTAGTVVLIGVLLLAVKYILDVVRKNRQG